MQSDFHYAAIRTLAQCAGLPEGDAQTMAFASQYVDDATEHKGIVISGIPDVLHKELHDRKMINAAGRFEPICTAHKGIQYLSGLRKDVQRKVYIPFHFVPGYSKEESKRFDYRVRAGGQMISELLDHWLGRLGDEEQVGGRQGAAVGVGVALHSYADSWSHQRFSGRHHSGDNDIERISVFREGKWERLGWWEQAKLNMMPDVGHVEAMNLPDQSHMTWRYEHDDTGILHTRENTEIFLDACEHIHRKLSEYGSERGRSWKEIVGRVRLCLENPTESVKEKFSVWQRAFPEVHLEYHAHDWRREALSGDRYDWDHFSDADDFGTLEYTATGKLRWFLFHLAARYQRETLSKQIPENLL